MSAYTDAKINEDKRNQGLNEAVGQVNAIYSGSGKQHEYDDFLSALRARSSASLGDQKAVLDRRTKFSSARRGVTGGSSDYDKQRRNRKQYISALLGAENNAQASVGRLRQSDENSRQNMLNMIYGGMDASTAVQRASQSMRSNLQSAQSDFVPYALDSIGEAVADAYGYGTRQDAYSQGGQAAREQLYGS